MDWFQRQREPTKIEFGIRDGRCLVRMGGKEMVSVSKVADKGGKISFMYSKLLFTVDNLKISGKLDREWLKKRLDELKSKKKLKTAPDPEPPPAGG